MAVVSAKSRSFVKNFLYPLRTARSCFFLAFFVNSNTLFFLDGPFF